MKALESSVSYLTFEDLLEKDGYIVFTNVGTSMMPLLRQQRDIIEIRPLSCRAQKYDVVLYKRNNMYILHRVIRALPHEYIIRGDNNIGSEYGITDNMILGVMTRIIRNGKSITPDNFWYKVYVHLWCDLYPVRVKLLKTKWFVFRCLRFVKRKVLRIKH